MGKANHSLMAERQLINVEEMMEILKSIVNVVIQAEATDRVKVVRGS